MKKGLVIVLLIFIVSLFMLITFSYSSVKDDLGDLNSYKPDEIENADTIVTKTRNILGIINVIGIVLSVIILMIIGIKYILGSVEERANYKETIKPYIIGALILFTGTLLPNIIYQLVTNF